MVLLQLFTFQSGDIQIELILVLNRIRLQNLHSNLVIFKCYNVTNNPKVQILFTFQSGDIQIGELTEKANSNLLRFTFQSGDIQIHHTKRILSSTTLHLHSNLVIFKLQASINELGRATGFTFQSGDIQMTAAIRL